MSEPEFRGYYPGSKKPLPEGAPRKKRVQKTDHWDVRPTKKFIKGEPVDLFSIGSLCLALGRPPVTVRLWIRQGHLPKAPFKMPDKNGIKGRRLYRREHIEAIVRVAERHGLIDLPRVVWARFPTFADDVRKEWNLLQDR